MQAKVENESVSKTLKRSSGNGPDLLVEDCEGYLWMKRINHKSNSYVKAWCALKNKQLILCKKKDGKHLEEINIEVSRIIPRHKNRSNNLYFVIIYDWSKFYFKIKNEKVYEVWIKRLQSIVSHHHHNNNNTENCLNQKSIVQKQLNQDDCNSPSHKTDPRTKFEFKLPDQNKLVDADETHDSFDLEYNNKNTNHFTNPRDINLLSVTLVPEESISKTDTKGCNHSNNIYDKTIDISDTNKFKSMRDFDSKSTENCSGYLWMKWIIHKKKYYVKTWCSLKNKVLSIYKKKDGKHIEDINIEVCRIIIITKDGSNTLCFQINDGWNGYIFGTKDEKAYEDWINKLQSISSNINSNSSVYQNAYVLKQFSRDYYNSDYIGEIDLKSPDQKKFVDVYDTCDLVYDNKINNRITNPRGIRFASDGYINETDAEDTNKSQSMRNLKIESQTSTRSRNDFDSQSNLSAKNCKGYLWVKTICDLERTYVKIWCTLENKILGLYLEKDGKHLEDINIEVSKIRLVSKHRSNNFYFRIINDETEFTFGTRSEKEYENWINRLKSIALNINS